MNMPPRENREPNRARRDNRASPIPLQLPLGADRRWPTRLPEETLEAALSLPVPVYPVPPVGRPRFSIVVLTFNQLAFTRLCLTSVLEASRDSRYELIVVDNGSIDGTADYLQRLHQSNPQVRLILNNRNVGFAAGNNLGLRRAEGEILVLLNNDTIVPPGWLEALGKPLQDRRIGMTGPLTNRSGGENEVECPYLTYGEFLDFARDVAKADPKPHFDCSMLPMFCAALARPVWLRVGPFDERYQIGLFEDDDYCMRLAQAGYQLRVVSECFIHHFGQVSMGDARNYNDLFRANRDRFERKWGIEWKRAARPLGLGYLELVARLRDMVARSDLGAGAIAVVSRGDEVILRLGHPTVHFMQSFGGCYAGHHPRDSAEALGRLRQLRGDGVDYLLIPETSRWWIEFYSAFGEFLSSSQTMVSDEPGTGVLYRLTKNGATDTDGI